MGTNWYLDQIFRKWIDSLFYILRMRKIIAYDEHRIRASHTGHDNPKEEWEDCNIKIDGRNLFNQPIKTDNVNIPEIRLQVVKEMITQLSLAKLSLFQKTL